MKSHLDTDLACQTSQSSSDFSSSPKQARSDCTIPIPKFACTVDERVTVLQAYQRAERARNPTSRATVVDAFQHSEGGGAEDFSLVNVPNPIRGTCPDMCPELERYLRDMHQRVSVFECLPSTLGAGSSGWQMDHTRAVKDYERSSADQPTPLPCELRPTAVLQRTMAYLLASVADRPELDQSRNFWKSWYEFMWTRTRAIRKDVAQQRLCCPQIVGVMERIARFHIFCAARLVDQPVDSFDPRINSENLTQCLQTLKEMYNDLYSTATSCETSVCPCEAEFRAYMLLMKLNDQSALNEVQMLPDHLLRSTEIRFAVAVHEAVTTTNYIRFFRLARMATCLNACLMHRYFVQIRGRALLRLAASFAGHPKREVQYPVETLTRQLGFENRNEAREFCESWGMSVVDDFILFDKQTPPQPPELAWRERRAIRLIESKRAGTALSTLFNNGPVAPSDAQPLPVHSSFDSSGRFVGHVKENIITTVSDSTTSDDNSLQTSQSIFGHQASLESDLVSRPEYTLEHVESTSGESNLAQPPLGSDRQRSIEMMDNPISASDFVDDLISELLDLKSVARETITGELLAREIHLELIDEVIHSLLRGIVHVVWDTEQKGRFHYHLGYDLCATIVAETITTEVTKIVQTVLTQEFVVNEIFWNDLVHHQINALVKSCLIKAEADEYYQRALVRRCFDHMQTWMCRKAQNEHDLALLRSMPPCPSVHLDALRLAGLCATKGRRYGVRRTQSNNENPSSPGNSVFVSQPLSRFSVWAERVDHHLTWSPFALPKKFSGHRIALYHSFDSPHSSDIDHEQFCEIVIPWLRSKLMQLHPVLITDTAVLPKGLCAVFCVNHPSSSFHKVVCEQNLPLLVVLPSQWIESTGDVIESRPASFRYLTLPCWENGQFTPHIGWVSVLQTELDWLESTIESPCNRSPSDAVERRVTELFPSPKPSLRLQFVQLIHQLIAAQFVQPMSVLCRGWSARGMVDPSLESLVDAYQLVLGNILHRIREYSIASETEKLLDIRTTFRTHFRSTISSPEVHPWIQFVAQWRAWATQLQTAPEHVNTIEFAIQRARLLFQHQIGQFGPHGKQTEILPDPMLAPCFRICMTTVRDRLDKLAISDADSVPEYGSVEALLNELNRERQLQCKTGQDPCMTSLDIHFSQLGQPATSVAVAIESSVDAFRKNQISSVLTGPIPKDHKCTDLKTKLNQLMHRLDDVELTMSLTLEENEAHSFSSEARSNPSRCYSCKH